VGGSVRVDRKSRLIVYLTRGGGSTNEPSVASTGTVRASGSVWEDNADERGR